MKYYKTIENNKVKTLGFSANVPGNSIEITENEYNSLSQGIQTAAEEINKYCEKVKNGELTIEDVPEEYYNEVYKIINTPELDPAENPDYMAGYEQALLDLAEVE